MFSLKLPNMLLGPEARWKKASAQAMEASSDALGAYYAAGLPNKRTSVERASILALDFETTGLDPASDEILSMGWVVIEHGHIQMSSAEHDVVRPKRELRVDTIPIHGIGHDATAAALPLEDVLPKLLHALKGRVLLAHHCKIELGFLDAACQVLYGVPFCALSIDTLVLEQRTHQRRGMVVAAGGYRLDVARKRYHLPRYKAHNACTDALAAAELFLAQVSYMGGCKKVHISEVLT